MMIMIMIMIIMIIIIRMIIIIIIIIIKTIIMVYLIDPLDASSVKLHYLQLTQITPKIFTIKTIRVINENMG